MTGKKNYKEKETLKTRGTKKFLRRVIEEEEAEDMIRNPDDDEELPIDKLEKLQLDKDRV